MASRRHSARTVNDLSEFNASVDLIVPFHGQYDRVTNLLESIFRLTRSNYYFVYLVDDCSPNSVFIARVAENAKRNAERGHRPNVVTCVRNETQLGFGASCRIGYERGTSPYVCFIHSDCLVEDSGWLKNMGESLLKLKEKGVRMIVPMTNNPAGGHPEQQGEKFARSENDFIVDDGYLSMYCFMCHRDLFKHCGGFIKEYPYGYYEDEEFAYRMKKYGFKQAVCKSSWIRHEGSATVREVMRRDPNVRFIMEAGLHDDNPERTIIGNRDRCLDDLKNLAEVKSTAQH